MKIVIEGRIDIEEKENVRGDVANAALRNGFCSRESFIPHLGRGLDEYELQGGHILIHLDLPRKQWVVVTQFASRQKILDQDILAILRSTHGQWSDGLGAGCFSDMEDHYRVRVDLSTLDIGDLQVSVKEQPNDSGLRSASVYQAAFSGNLPEAIELLDNGGDVDECRNGYTALCGAILGGHKFVAMELIRRGADIFKPCDAGEYALFCIACARDLSDSDGAELAEMMLANGVDPIKIRNGLTPLAVAVSRRKLKLELVLRAFGAV